MAIFAPVDYSNGKLTKQPRVLSIDICANSLIWAASIYKSAKCKIATTAPPQLFVVHIMYKCHTRI